MSREVSIWQIGSDSVERVSLSGIDLEHRLQGILANNISILDQQLLVIGREVQVGTSGRIDILAVDPDGSLVVIELKRGRTPREVVAQTLDYGSWIDRWGPEEIQQTFVDYQRRYLNANRPQLVEVALKAKFAYGPDDLNGSHRLVIVASELDPATKRIVDHLQARYSVPISVETFQSFRDGPREFLVRSHDIEVDPFADGRTLQSETQREWNGEYYANFGEYADRPWRNGKDFGFIRAGGGARFKRHLERLPEGGRVWVKIPGKGFVAVGRVTAEAVPYAGFEVVIDGEKKLLSQIESDVVVAEDEYVVAVDWIHAVGVRSAVKGKGLFGNQNTVAQPTDPKWEFTVEVLKQAWGIE